MTVTFLLTSLVIVVTPGTGVLLTVTAGLSRGTRASVITAIGCTLGIVPHLLAAILGAAAVLRASGVAFEFLRAFGVAYLLLLSVQTWRDRSDPVAMGARPAKAPVKIMLSAAAANLLNPKLTLFFFAFLPQFIHAGSPHPTTELLLLSATFMVMTLVVFTVYGVFASGVRNRVLRRANVLRRLRQIFALTFVGLAARLATTDG